MKTDNGTEYYGFVYNDKDLLDAYEFLILNYKERNKQKASLSAEVFEYNIGCLQLAMHSVESKFNEVNLKNPEPFIKIRNDIHDILNSSDAIEYLKEAIAFFDRIQLQITETLMQTPLGTKEYDTCRSNQRCTLVYIVCLRDLLEKKESLNIEFNIEDIYFESSIHSRYENGILVSGPHSNTNRAIKVEPNTEGKEGYTVTIFNLDGNHPLWGNNIQMAPKQMKLESSTTNKTILRGWGSDPRAFGHQDGEFSNYGISIFHKNSQVEKIVMHMHDRNVDIEYFK